MTAVCRLVRAAQGCAGCLQADGHDTSPDEHCTHTCCCAGHDPAVRMPAPDDASATWDVKARHECSPSSYLAACGDNASCRLRRYRGGLASGLGASTLGGFLCQVQSSLGRATAQAPHSSQVGAMIATDCWANSAHAGACLVKASSAWSAPSYGSKGCASTVGIFWVTWSNTWSWCSNNWSNNLRLMNSTA